MAGQIAPAPGCQATACYDDGEPMSYAAFSIKAPGTGPAFQTGRTDRNGVVMFRPDAPGLWQVEIKDGMGHRVALELTVTEENTPLANMPPSKRMNSRSQGVITGLALVFGLTGLLYGWHGRKKMR